jgi:PHD/YefM family antitoxin component YafN of YafNO toxin-antitoxin module
MSDKIIKVEMDVNIESKVDDLVTSVHDDDAIVYFTEKGKNLGVMVSVDRYQSMLDNLERFKNEIS